MTPPLSVELTADGPRLSHAEPRRPDAADAVLVEPSLVGVCRSDLKEIGGRRPGPSQFGHEVVGVVTTSSIARLPVGARVCLDPNVPLLRGTGFARAMWAGGDAGRLVQALPLAPPDVAERRLVFAEPLACAAHCLTMVRAHRGAGLRDASVCVLGAGMAGVLIARLAAEDGARARIVNRDPDRLEFLASRDALPGIEGAPLSSSLPADHDVVVIATDFVRPSLLSRALELVRPGGLVMLYGGTAAGDALPGLDCDLDTVRRAEKVNAASWHGRPVLVGGSYGTTTSDFHEALRALTETPDGLGVERLITAEVSLPELPDALHRMASSRHLGKVLLRP